jgi:hypothetical protein
MIVNGIEVYAENVQRCTIWHVLGVKVAIFPPRQITLSIDKTSIKLIRYWRFLIHAIVDSPSLYSHNQPWSKSADDVIASSSFPCTNTASATVGIATVGKVSDGGHLHKGIPRRE